MAEQKRNTRNSKSTKIQPVNDYGRIQPQAPELEEAVLGALMIEKDAYSLVSEILRPESFYERRHQLIYSAIVDLAVNQKPVDILTVKEQLSKRGDLEEMCIRDSLSAASSLFRKQSFQFRQTAHSCQATMPGHVSQQGTWRFPCS